MAKHYTSGYASTPSSLGLGSRADVQRAQQTLNAQLGGNYLVPANRMMLLHFGEMNWFIPIRHMKIAG